MDKVQPKALKKKFDDRKDKDIDNDGDEDDSDEYLHNRRKTVSKAVKEEPELDEAPQPKWKVQIGNKHYTVTARNTAEANTKAKKLAAKDGNSGVGGKIERIREEVELEEKRDIKVTKGSKERMVNKQELGTYKQMGWQEVKEEVELDEAVAKIACLKCDEVSTAAAWKKKGGFCPKCKTSSQGVAESVELDEGAKERALKALMTKALGGKRAKAGYTSAVANNGDFVVKDGGGRVVGRIEAGKFKDPLKEADEYTDDEVEVKKAPAKKKKGKEDPKNKSGEEVDVEPTLDEAQEMTPEQEKMREKYVMKLKGRMDEFKKKYGDRAEKVMYATATKMAMKK